MTKAEQRALEAYPVKEEWAGNQYGEWGDTNATSRVKYQEGYRQAEKDVKERLLLMLNTSIDNKQFFEQLDDYFAELETSNER